MRLADFANRLGTRAVPTAWVEHWDDFTAQDDPARRQHWINGDLIDQRVNQLSLTAPVRAALHQHLADLDELPELDRLLRFSCFLFYDRGVFEGLGHWPILDDKQWPGGNMVYACVFLAGYDHARKLHADLGIDEAVTRQTLADLGLWVQEYRDQHGHWGLKNLAWVGNYFLKTRVIQLGRLQFESNTFGLGFRGYRRRGDGRLLVLARDGQRFRHDGQFEGENQTLDPEGPWVSTLEQDGDALRGHVVSGGAVAREAASFDGRQWAPAFDKGSPALSVHIPAGGGLSAEACRESIRRAAAFFPRHFPDKPFDLIWCHSWLMDPQLQEYLPPQSNIAGFQKLFHLVPRPNTSGWQTLERTFGRSDIDLSTVDAHSSLQRAVLEHHRRGRRWRCPAGVMLPEGPAYPVASQPADTAGSSRLAATAAPASGGVA